MDTPTTSDPTAAALAEYAGIIAPLAGEPSPSGLEAIGGALAVYYARSLPDQLPRARARLLALRRVLGSTAV